MGGWGKGKKASTSGSKGGKGESASPSDEELDERHWVFDMGTAMSAGERRRYVACVGRFFDLQKLHRHPSCMSGDSTPSYLLHSDLGE